MKKKAAAKSGRKQAVKDLSAKKAGSVKGGAVTMGTKFQTLK